MTTETGPIYGIPLIDSLPLGNDGMLQQMPSRHDLAWCQDVNAYRVAAGYEVLLAHYHRVCEERDRLKSLVIEISEDMGDCIRGHNLLSDSIRERIENEVSS